MKVHVKNNRTRLGTFPNTPEGEAVFTISREHIGDALAEFLELVGQIVFYIDWDTDHFASSMADSEVLLTRDLPTASLSSVAPQLRWIHCIGAGVEHLLPMDWLPEQVTLTNNKGVHAAKAEEFGLMTVLMLCTHIPAVTFNQRNAVYDSLYPMPMAGKTMTVLETGKNERRPAAKTRSRSLKLIPQLPPTAMDRFNQVSDCFCNRRF